MTIRSTHIATAYIALIQKYGGTLAAQMLSAFLQEKKITALIPQIQSHIRAYIKKQSAYDTLRITIPHAATQSLLDTITGYIQKSTGTLPHATEVRVDPQIIGGFTTTFRGVTRDGSVRSILHALQTK
jgi:F0F1-type ATP synthase delta subunit